VVEVPSSLRGSVDVFSMDRYFHIGLVSSMWKSSVMPLKTLGNSLYELIIKVNDLLINVI
jgi:hypothetical protein